MASSSQGSGLGILDSKDWDQVKDLDWEEKSPAAWKIHALTTTTTTTPSRVMHSPKASWAFKRLRAALWPKSNHHKSSSSVSGPTNALRKTAYLDGIRGFAAFLVYWQHHELWAHPTKDIKLLENGFGFEGQYRFASFPFVRLLFNGGHFAVATFFIISGYVLSVKPLSLIHAGDQAKLADNLGSQLFRRWLRLYLPLMGTTFLYMLSWHVPFGGLWIHGVKKKGSLRDEMWSWYAELKNFSFVFNMGGDPWFTYNNHLWSIPVEMKGSIAVFTILLALSRASRNARLWLTAGLMFYFMYICDGWYCTLFLMGVFLADLDLLAAKNQLPRVFSFSPRLARYREFIYYHMLAIAMYLGGIPAETADVADLARNRGWYYLAKLKPQAAFDYKWFYLFFAATLLVVAVPRLAWPRRFFESRACQYLGRISYALYLVHGPVLWTLGDRLYTAVGFAGNNGAEELPHLTWWIDRFPLPRGGPLGLEVAFLLPHLVLLPVTFWAAEMVMRWMDAPAVRFAQWVYRATLAEEAGTPAAVAAAVGPAAVNGMDKKLDA